MYRTWYKKAKDWGLGSLSRLRNKKKPKFGLKKPELPTPIHDYFEAQKRHFLMAWGELYQPTGKSTWEYDLASFDVTRIISPTKSFVYLTAGLYQPPFFHDDAPTIVNLAGLGALATEGLAHSLGYYGAKYGTLSYIQDGVWSADAEKARSKQMQCLADRYDGIEVKVSQGRTSQLRGASKGLLDDAIASALGTEAAYRAWKERYKVEMPVTLPGMANFTTDQLFFILRSASSCGVESPGTLEDRIRAGRGLPVHLRTRAQVEDSQAWHDAFKCKPKAPLCPVWGPVRSPVIEEPIKLP
jgi:predicted metalloendopeptidase